MKLNLNSLMENKSPRQVSWRVADHAQFTYITTIRSYPELVVLSIDPTRFENCFIDFKNGNFVYSLSSSRTRKNK